MSDADQRNPSGEGRRRRGEEWLGRVLAARYRVESLLGSGGMGSVFEAQDLRLQRRVVVKVPHEVLLSEPGFRERFAREVSSLTRLEHPNVVQIHDVGEQDGVPFAVVQYLAGGDLGDRMDAHGCQTPEEVLAWLAPVARTLDHVFAAGFVHRDVKPENILFDGHGNVYLSDFGIATALGAGDAEGKRPDARLTRPGTFIGAATYAPPEAVGRELNAAYDQYSLAVTVYEALCGDVPFERQAWMDLMLAKQRGEPAPLRERAPEVPERVADVVMKALSRDPAARYPSCTAFADAFREATAPRPAEAADRPPRSRAPRLLAAGVLAALAAGALWWLARSAPDFDTVAIAADGPVTFRAGSTGAEMAAAYVLCERHVASCPDYEAGEAIREVTIAPFELDRREVTNRQFAAFVEDTGHVTTAEQRGLSYHRLRAARGFHWAAPFGPDTSWQERPDHPVVHVSWTDAERFCEWRDMRLPSEDEWELAARGAERRVFPWGDAWADGLANWGRPRDGGPRRAGSYPDGATPEGVLDLGGNVAEWTADGEGRERITKGGSWLDANPANLRAAARRREEADYSSSDLGFRCAR